MIRLLTLPQNYFILTEAEFIMGGYLLVFLTWLFSFVMDIIFLIPENKKKQRWLNQLPASEFSKYKFLERDYELFR